jgi:hypothetical protein
MSLWLRRSPWRREAETHPCHINGQLSWQDLLAHPGKSLDAASHSALFYI